MYEKKKKKILHDRRWYLPPTSTASRPQVIQYLNRLSTSKPSLLFSTHFLAALRSRKSQGSIPRCLAARGYRTPFSRPTCTHFRFMSTERCACGVGPGNEEIRRLPRLFSLHSAYLRSFLVKENKTNTNVGAACMRCGGRKRTNNMLAAPRRQACLYMPVRSFSVYCRRKTINRSPSKKIKTTYRKETTCVFVCLE